MKNWHSLSRTCLSILTTVTNKGQANSGLSSLNDGFDTNITEIKMITIEEGLERIKTMYPQAHIEKGKVIPHNRPCKWEDLLIVPSVLLPPGWYTDELCSEPATICTVLTKIPKGFPAVRPNGFWIDIGRLRIAGGKLATSTNNASDRNLISGYPHWYDLTYFHWKLQDWNPNTDSLVTWLSVIKHRLNPAR